MIENLKQELADLTAKFDRLAEEDKLTPGKHQLALNAMGMDIQFLADEINSLETTDDDTPFKNSLSLETVWGEILLQNAK